jgi:chloride channel 7
MLEATGDVQYVLPLMVTLLTARWVGNALNDGLYDIHIHLNGWPILEPNCPEVAVKNDMCVKEIMSESTVKIAAIMRVGELFDIIERVNHNIFPIEQARDTLFQGTITRDRTVLSLPASIAATITWDLSVLCYNFIFF